MKNKIVLYLILISILFITCKPKPSNLKSSKTSFASSLGDSSIIDLSLLDSLIANQIYDLRLQALELQSSKLMLNLEARKQKISITELVKKEIKKDFIVTEKEIIDYRVNINNPTFEKQKIIDYLVLQKQQKRHKLYTDSLKQAYTYKVKLIPPFLTKLNTSNLKAFNINLNKSTNEVIIISDFDCSSCQHAEKEIKKIISKYTKSITFKFLYFSDYIDPDILTACHFAEQNNQFMEFQDSLFNSKIDTLIKMDLKRRIYGIKKVESNILMKDAIKNKAILGENKIFTTPTFIVNGKILDGKYAIDYLVDVINNEFNLNE